MRKEKRRQLEFFESTEDTEALRSKVLELLPLLDTVASLKAKVDAAEEAKAASQAAKAAAEAKIVAEAAAAEARSVLAPSLPPPPPFCCCFIVVLLACVRKKTKTPPEKKRTVCNIAGVADAGVGVPLEQPYPRGARQGAGEGSGAGGG